MLTIGKSSGPHHREKVAAAVAEPFMKTARSVPEIALPESGFPMGVVAAAAHATDTMSVAIATTTVMTAAAAAAMTAGASRRQVKKH